MALIPVKWNWEDQLDKQNEKKHRDTLCDILETIVDDIYKIQQDISDLESRQYKVERRQSKVERQLRTVIKRRNNSSYHFKA